MWRVFKKDFIYLFLERGGREGESEGEKHCCVRQTSNSCLLHTPNWGPVPQPRHVPWLRMEPAAFWFAGPHSIHWAITAKARGKIFMAFTDVLNFAILFHCSYTYADIHWEYWQKETSLSLFLLFSFTSSHVL